MRCTLHVPPTLPTPSTFLHTTGVPVQIGIKPMIEGWSGGRRWLGGLQAFTYSLCSFFYTFRHMETSHPLDRLASRLTPSPVFPRSYLYPVFCALPLYTLIIIPRSTFILEDLYTLSPPSTHTRAGFPLESPLMCGYMASSWPPLGCRLPCPVCATRSAYSERAQDEVIVTGIGPHSQEPFVF